MARAFEPEKKLIPALDQILLRWLDNKKNVENKKTDLFKMGIFFPQKTIKKNFSCTIKVQTDLTGEEE